MKTLVLLFGALLLAGCAVASSLPTATLPAPSATKPPTATVTATPSPSPPPILPSPQPSATPTPQAEICAPLGGIALADLPGRIVNPFAPPPPGSDDPHQGVDFAEIDPIYQFALEGLPVQAVLQGVIAGQVVDRFPYGNAVLIETSLGGLPPEWRAALQIPTPAPLREGHPSLTCPQISVAAPSLAGPRSIYLLYGHLQAPPAFQMGEAVACGQVVGAIGNSGNALNPHLHLEMRVGPAGARFESMAHYTGSAQPAEMTAYCLWRVSEAFQLLDPMRLLRPGGD